MPELKTEQWQNTTPVSVQLSRSTRYGRAKLEAHLHTNGRACRDSTFGSESLVMQAMDFCTWDKGCTECQQVLAQKLDRDDVRYGSLKEELYSTFGRPASQILLDEGLVECAANAFGAKNALVVAGLAGCSLGEVLEVVHSGNHTQYSVKCPNCLETTGRRYLGRWPHVKRFQLNCQSCDEQTDINLYEYYPGQDWAEAYLEEGDVRSYSTANYNLVWHDMELEEAIRDFDEDEVDVKHIHPTQVQTTVHEVVDDPDGGVKTKCGANINADPRGVYDINHLNDCGNCQ